MAKRYEELTIEDDFMFGKVMEDKELCRDVLKCLLEEPVGELEDVQTQREFRYTSKGKPIRLDVYTRDQKRIYDAEMQRLNHQTPENLELPRRSRFYQATMDTDHLSRGKSYRELPEGKVLFICTFDPFGLGYAKYSFQNFCMEDRKLCLEDGTGKVGDDLTRRIDEAVIRARKNEEWRSEYMKELLHDDDVRAEGRTEGEHSGKNKMILLISRMNSGGDADKIVQLSDPKVLEVMQEKYGIK